MRLRAALALGLVAILARASSACPFCTAVKPSLSERREDAVAAALVEASSISDDGCDFAIHKLLNGTLLDGQKRLTLKSSDVVGAGDVKAGQLGLLLATREGADAKLVWEFLALDEVGYAYVVRSPVRRLPAAERLLYFARFLEHPNPLLAEDAYLEFGRASYDDVATVADKLPYAAMRKWIVDPAVPDERKGFYGLALGLARSDQDRRANQHVLRKLVDAPADDFRAGYDGILGGYLVLTGTQGLAHIDQQMLSDRNARTGDLRHALTALRFIYEFGHGAIPQAALNRAMRRLLDRPETAAAAIVDLARWQDWDCLDTVAALFDREEYDDAATTRAIVGFLAACPRPAAAHTLTELRKRAPQRVAEAEKKILSPVTAQ